MDSRSAAKVGMLVIFALLVLVGMYFYLAHISPNTYIIRVSFDDTRGVLRQSIVRMRGVQLGEVKKVELVNLKPVVTLVIQNDQKIPLDSKFSVVSGLLIANPQIEIVPGKSDKFLKEDSIVKGEEPLGTLASLSPEVALTVNKLNSTFDNLNTKFGAAYKKIDVLLDNSNKLINNVNTTVISMHSLVGSPELKKSLLETVSNFKIVSQDARITSHQLSADLHEMVKSGKGSFTDLTSKLGDILTRIDGTIDDANTIVKKLTEQVTDPRLQQSLQETAELARTTLARFNQIASDIHSLTGDPQLQSDLKQSVQNLKNATSKGEQAVSRVNDLLGGGTPGTGAGDIVKKHLKIPKIDLIANVSEQIDPTKMRVDIDAQIHAGKTSYLDLGLYDLGQNTRLNLQVGNHLSDTLTARYGLHASKIGAGMDWNLKSKFGIQADFYDTNHPRLDAKGIFRVNNDASIWIGAEGIFRRPVPVLGIQFRK